MLDLIQTEKAFIAPHIVKGGVAVDFTMGNGHDTLYLCRAVGEGGRVYAFDIQQAALDSTAALLKAEGAPENYKLIKASHHLAPEYVKEPICVGMFNLGWLPGGDKSITTLRETTLPAIENAVNMLASDGALLIAVYPGHDEGRAEGELIEKTLSALDRRKICVSKLSIVNSYTSPYFFLIEKK